MGPKVEAAVDFARTTGKEAVSGALKDLSLILKGTSGTRVSMTMTEIAVRLTRTCAALPDARLLVLAGQQHIADILDPEKFAMHLLEFLHRPAPRTGGLSG